MELNKDKFLNGKRLISQLPELEGFIQFLEESYRNKLWKELPPLIHSFDKAIQDKSLHYPHLMEVLVHLDLVYSLLVRHLSEEADLLAFLFKKEEGKFSAEEPQALRQFVGLMKYEHDIVMEGFSRIRKVCNNYEPPLDDGFLPALYSRLESCDKLLLEQMALENNIIFEMLEQRAKEAPKG